MVSGAEFLGAAMKYKGVPYFEGNPQTPHALDCSGLIQFTCRDLGMNISRTTFTQFADASNHVGPGKIVSRDLAQAQQGDVIYYVGHVEIWVGGGKVFSEATDGTVADVRNRTPWSIQGIVRYADGGPGGDVVLGPGGAANATNANAISDALDPFGVVGKLVSPIKDLMGFTQAISDFFTKIGKPAFWIRAGAAVLGAMALVMGFYGVTKSEMNLSKMASGATQTAKSAVKSAPAKAAKAPVKSVTETAKEVTKNAS